MGRKERVFRIAVFCAAAAGLVWFLIPLHWNVFNVGNASGLAVCAVLLAGSAFYGGIRRACARSYPLRAIFGAAAALLCLGAAWSAAMTVHMAAGMRSAPPPEGAAVVVLGSKVNGTAPSADLWARIGAASRYLKAHPKSVCIACGGRGAGESVTEASAIRDALARDGIDPGRIFTEETSASTRENLGNALRIADARGLGRTLAIVTDGYHEFRARSLARSLGAEAYAVPARTPWYILSACWAREVLALTKYYLIPG